MINLLSEVINLLSEMINIDKNIVWFWSLKTIKNEKFIVCCCFGNKKQHKTINVLYNFVLIAI